MERATGIEPALSAWEADRLSSRVLSIWPREVVWPRPHEVDQEKRGKGSAAARSASTALCNTPYVNTADAAIIVGALSLVGTVLNSIVTARTAGKTSSLQAALQTEVEKEKLVESRVGSVKREMYLPLISALVAVMNTDEQKNSQRQRRNAAADGSLLGAITLHFPSLLTVGSDGAILAFSKLMQAAYNAAPTMIFLRLWSEFILEARKDMRDMATGVTPATILACKINDLHTDSDSFDAATLPFDELARKLEWRIPWANPQNPTGQPLGQDSGVSSAPIDSTEDSDHLEPPPN